MRAALVIAELFQQFPRALPAIDIHRRRAPGAAAVIDEARQQPALAVDPRGVVVRETGGLFPLGHAVLDIVVLEAGGVENFGQRQVEDADIDREIVAPVAVVVPRIGRRQHEVARAEDDVLALHAGEVALPGEPDPDRVYRVPVRRHDLARIVEPVGGIERRHRRPHRGEAGIDQDHRPALRIVHRDKFGRLVKNRLYLVVFPYKWTRLPGLQDLRVLVVLGIAADRPVGRHVMRIEPPVERIEARVAVGARCRFHGGHGFSSQPVSVYGFTRQTAVWWRSTQTATTSSGSRFHQLPAEKISTSFMPS